MNTTTTKEKTQAEANIELLQAVNQKISSQRNAAHDRIAQLELVIESNRREIQNLKATIEGNKLFKENKDKK
jgi:peptidoglycan hydrolase CwlO-like protein